MWGLQSKIACGAISDPSPAPPSLRPRNDDHSTLGPREKATRPLHILPAVFTQSTQEISLLHASPEGQKQKDQPTSEQEKGIGADQGNRQDHFDTWGLDGQTVNRSNLIS
jgi:hypothetical protein